VPQKLKLSELGRLSPNEFQQKEKNPFVVVLDNVRSLNNVGSVFRTADAFLCEKIYLCGITGIPPHREITKTAIGADKTVEWQYYEDTATILNKLKQDGYTLMAVEQVRESKSLGDIIWPGGKIAFVFGNEIDGIGERNLEICDSWIEIPQQGTKHSLNISVAAGIVLWDFIKARLY
jgi:tRNA G18 (ribose-2'-O)-methylase SpoU